MRSWLALAIAFGVLLAGGGIVWLTGPTLMRVRVPIRVGLLHSVSGPMAVNETSMVDAEVLALEEINNSGGLLGRKIEWVIVDGKSAPEIFAREAERLITEKKVSVIIGAYNSACRKSIKSVVEQANHLLIYPVAYEGLEESPNIVYTGAAPNQQIIPAVNWCRDKLGAKSFFLVGNDHIWSHAVHTIIRDQLKAVGAALAGEEYVEFGSNALDGAVGKAIAAKPDVILNTLLGDSNLPFYKALRGRNHNASGIATLSFIVAEDELQGLPARQMVNDYSACNYFQSIDRPENLEFVRKFRTRFGTGRVTSDSMETAYNSVRFWAQAVLDADTDLVGEVRTALLSQSLNAPEGVISIDRDSQHTWRPFYVGRIKGDGQIDIVESISKPIRPVPFPFSRTHAEWTSFLENLSAGWGGAWEAPAARRADRGGL